MKKSKTIKENSSFGLNGYLLHKPKAPIILFFFFVSLFVFMVSTLIALRVTTESFGLLIGVLLMCLSIPFHIGGKRYGALYLPAILFNCVGAGFSASAYYIFRELSPGLLDLLLPSIPAMLLVTLLALLLLVYPRRKKTLLAILTPIAFLIAGGAVTLWILYKTVYLSFFFFSMMFALFYFGAYGVSINHPSRLVLRDISFANFGAFIILTVVIIVILSEGEVLDGADFDFSSADGKKKKKLKK